MDGASLAGLEGLASFIEHSGAVLLVIVFLAVAVATTLVMTTGSNGR